MKIGIYHGDCTDGTTAAAVLLKKFTDIKVFPLKYGFKPDDFAPISEAVKDCEEIYLVDCAFNAREFLAQGKKVTIIDHHIGIKDEMEKLDKENDNLKFVFDNDKSGSSLTWSYLFPEEKLPELIKYVEDSDLWLGRYGDDTKNITNYLYLFINQPETILGLFGSDLSVVKEKGTLISQYIDFQAGQIVNEIGPINLQIGNYNVPAYNITVYSSQIGNRLARQKDQTAVMFTILGSQVKFNIRSINGHKPNALELAKLLGGGGHDNSAGAVMPFSDFLKLIVK